MGYYPRSNLESAGVRYLAPTNHFPFYFPQAKSTNYLDKKNYRLIMRLADLVLLVATILIASCNALSSGEMRHYAVQMPGVEVHRSLAAANEDIASKRLLRSSGTLVMDSEDTGNEERAFAIPGLSTLKSKAGALFDKLRYMYWAKRGKTDVAIYSKWLEQGKTDSQIYRLFIRNGKTDDDIYKIWVVQRKTDNQIYNLLIKNGKTDDDIYKIWLRWGKTDKQIYNLMRRNGKTDHDIYKIWLRQRKTMEEINVLWRRVGMTDTNVYNFLVREGVSMGQIYELWLRLGKSDNLIYGIWLREGKSMDEIYNAWFFAKKTPDASHYLMQSYYGTGYQQHINKYMGYRSFYNEKHGIREM